MTQRQRDAVYGYVRLNYGRNATKDIIGVIYKFYLITIASNILNLEEQSLFMDLLFCRLLKQEGNEDMKSIDTELLFRASEYQERCEKFYEICNNKGPTISIIHNEYDHIYGGYVSKSWDKSNNTSSLPTVQVADPNVFLFTIRPTMKCIELKKEWMNGEEAITIYTDHGPIFGAGWDLWTQNAANNGLKGCGKSRSFTFTEKEMFGTNDIYSFKLLEIETFSIIIE